MLDAVRGEGNFRGIGITANRDFKKDEVVIPYHLRELTREEFLALPKNKHAFVHSFWGKRYLFEGNSKYTNHSSNPTTYQDLGRMADVALRDIRKGESITTNATQEIKNEITTFLEAYEKESTVRNIQWQKLGYRNAKCTYLCDDQSKTVTMKRIDGNWEILNTGSTPTP